MARKEQAGTIINRTAVEVGLRSVPDPFSTQDEGFTQLASLLNVAGQELAMLRNWNELLRTFEVDTSTDLINGNQAALPDDYDHIILQSGWDLTNDVPVIGPLSPQDWAYLQGRGLAQDTIYISYRVYQGNLEFYPITVPTGTTLSFRYISRNWAENSDNDGIDFCTASNNVVQLDPLLMQKFLKVKFLDAKNLPSQAARIEFETILQNRFGADNGAKVLNAGSNFRQFPYLNNFYNTPDTNFGA